MKKNMKTIVGIAIGLIIGISTTVGAATIFNSKDITYSSDKTDKTNVKDSLDELYIKAAKVGACPEGSTCLRPISTVEVGDYIFFRLGMGQDEFTVSKTLTGHTSDQTVRAYNYYLWRVIRKNGDGTVEAVSVSDLEANAITFKGAVGYKNYEQVLYNVASALTIFTPGIESGRAFGFAGIGSGQKLTCTATNTSTSCPSDNFFEDDFYAILRIDGWAYDDFYGSFIMSRTWVDVKNLQVKKYTNSHYQYENKNLLLNNVAQEVAGKVKIIINFSSDVLVEGQNNSRDNPFRATYLG